MDSKQKEMQKDKSYLVKFKEWMVKGTVSEPWYTTEEILSAGKETREKIKKLFEANKSKK